MNNARELGDRLEALRGDTEYDWLTAINQTMQSETERNKFILAKMKDLVNADRDPCFSSYQCMEGWAQLRQILTWENKRALIIGWDAAYDRMIGLLK